MRITKRNKSLIIIRYLDNDLAPEEVEIVEDRIKTDPEFAKEVKFSKSIDSFFSNNMERVKTEIEMREQLNNIHKEFVSKRKFTYKLKLFFRNLFHKKLL